MQTRVCRAILTACLLVPWLVGTSCVDEPTLDFANPCDPQVAGYCRDAGGEGEGLDPERPEYRYIIIADGTTDENSGGTPGADICGLFANCGADDFTAAGANMGIGAGTVCDGYNMNPPCEDGVNRANPTAALDYGDFCEYTSNPSDYVSLGLTGELAVEFNVDLTGCNITIFELEGIQNEPYSVYACQSSLLAVSTCINGGLPIGNSPAAGGSVTVNVPEPF